MSINSPVVSAPAPNFWGIAPTDLFPSIFGFVGLPEAVKMLSLSKNINACFSKPGVFRECKNNFVLKLRSTKYLKLFLTAASQLNLSCSCLDLSSKEMTHHQFIKIIASFPNIKSLTTDFWNPENISIQDLVAIHGTNLEVLDIRNSSELTDRAIEALTDHAPNLRILNLSDCIQLFGSDLGLLAKNCPNLQELGLDRCYFLTDDSIKALAEHAKNLRVLNLSGCSCLTDDSIKALAEHAKNLRDLDLSGCSCLTDDSIKALATTAKNLQLLKLSRFQRLHIHPDLLGKIMFINTIFDPEEVEEMPQIYDSSIGLDNKKTQVMFLNATDKENSVQYQQQIDSLALQLQELENSMAYVESALRLPFEKYREELRKQLLPLADPEKKQQTIPDWKRF